MRTIRYRDVIVAENTDLFEAIDNGDWKKAAQLYEALEQTNKELENRYEQPPAVHL